MSDDASKELSLLYKGPLDLYRFGSEAEVMLIDQQITRQQLGHLAGLSDDVLAFWIKNELLVAVAGGAGKGSHRRFEGFQVNIAAILAELRNLGINLAGLRSFASQLQAATALGRSAECNPWAFSDAQDLWNKVDAFNRGEPVRVVAEIGVEKLAMSVEDIHNHFRKWPSHLHDDFDKILAFASRLTADALPLLDLFMNVHGDAYRLVFDGKPMTYGDSSWLAVRQAEDHWQIFTGPARHDPVPYDAEIPSGIFLMPEVITRRAWRGRLSPILLQDIEPTDEERALMLAAQQRAARANRAYTLGVANRILDSEKSE